MVCVNGQLSQLDGGNHFQRSDLTLSTQFSEAKTLCKKGCDSNSKCQYATLENKSGKRWCDLYSDACQGGSSGGAGTSMYTKSNALRFETYNIRLKY